jgi:hypothetical protein
MNKILFPLFGFMLIATIALGGVYFVMSRNQGSDLDTVAVQESPEFAQIDDAYSNLETAVFTSEYFAFEYPDTWKPEVVNQTTGEVDLGIPAVGVITQRLSFTSGNFENIRDTSDAAPGVVGGAVHTLIDREGYSRVIYNEDTEQETYEFYAPGRTSNEVVKLLVRVDKQQITSQGIGSYLVELFDGLTILR